MKQPRIQVTANYRLFGSHNPENRPVEPNKHGALLSSMKRYGFLQSFPISAWRNKLGNLIVKDGQHRLYFAELLGLPVSFIVSNEDYDVAIVNSTPRVWVVDDYVRKYAANKRGQYQEGLAFAEEHRLPVGISFALLAGTTHFGNVRTSVLNGEWKIKDRAWADSVAGVYGPMVRMAPVMRNARFLAACMAACRVKGFDGSRLLANATRCREKLVAYSTRDAYLDMMEAVYNFGRHQLVGLKAGALMALKDRNPLNAKKARRE